MEEDLLQAVLTGLGAPQSRDPEDLGDSLKGGGIIGLVDRLVGAGLDALYHRQPDETFQTAPIGGPQLRRGGEPRERMQARSPEAQADATSVADEPAPGRGILDFLSGPAGAEEALGGPGALEMVDVGGSTFASLPGLARRVARSASGSPVRNVADEFTFLQQATEGIDPELWQMMVEGARRGSDSAFLEFLSLTESAKNATGLARSRLQGAVNALSTKKGGAIMDALAFRGADTPQDAIAFLDELVAEILINQSGAR